MVDALLPGEGYLAGEHGRRVAEEVADHALRKQRRLVGNAKGHKQHAKKGRGRVVRNNHIAPIERRVT